VLWLSWSWNLTNYLPRLALNPISASQVAPALVSNLFLSHALIS
jgi:hypothetical protein